MKRVFVKPKCKRPATGTPPNVCAYCGKPVRFNGPELVHVPQPKAK